MVRKGKSSESDKKILVRYKFKGLKKATKKWMTVSQYENLKVVPSIEYCEIVG